MGTEILRPQDCLIERLRVGPTTTVLPRRKYTANSNSKPTTTARRTLVRPEQAPKKHQQQHQRFPHFQPAATATTVVVTNDVVLRSKHTSNNININNINNVTIGQQVTILKRGESLNIIKNNNSNNNNHSNGNGNGDDCREKSLLKTRSSSTGDLIGAPDAGLISKEIRSTHEVYAGSAFYMSPSPSALPLPSFSIKKEGLAIVDDSATKDLRRLLRLD